MPKQLRIGISGNRGSDRGMVSEGEDDAKETDGADDANGCEGMGLVCSF